MRIELNLSAKKLKCVHSDEKVRRELTATMRKAFEKALKINPDLLLPGTKTLLAETPLIKNLLEDTTKTLTWEEINYYRKEFQGVEGLGFRSER